MSRLTDDYGIAETILPRVHISTKKAVHIFDRDKGVCWICKERIWGGRRGEDWHVAHDKAHAMGGTVKDENLHPAHARCNMQEAYEIITPTVAKCTRVRAKHIGAPKPKSHKPMSGGRESKFKKGFGKVINRETGEVVWERGR